MPAAWLGLVIVAAVALAIWLLGRRLRRAPGDAAPAGATLGAGKDVPAEPAKPAAPVQQSAGAQSQPARPAASPASAGALSASEIFHKFHEFAFAATPLAAAAPAAYEALATQARSVLETVATEPRYAPRRPLLLLRLPFP